MRLLRSRHSSDPRSSLCGFNRFPSMAFGGFLKKNGVIVPNNPASPVDLDANRDPSSAVLPPKMPTVNGRHDSDGSAGSKGDNNVDAKEDNWLKPELDTIEEIWARIVELVAEWFKR